MQRLVFLFLTVLVLNGCATVKFYDDANLVHRTGIKYFDPKPYLMISHKAKDQTDIQVVYLPDVTSPHYAYFSPGLGTHEFTLSVSNGILSSYGQKADTKIPELITSMTGLLGEGVKTAKEAGMFGPQAAPDYSALVTEIGNIANDLSTGVSKNPLEKSEKSEGKIAEVVKSLNDTKIILNRPVVAPEGVDTAIKKMTNAKEGLSTLTIKLPDKFDPTSPQARYNSLLETASNRIGAVLKALKPEVPSPQFELYEINQSATGTTLRRVQ
jgi:hypothetical protein